MASPKSLTPTEVERVMRATKDLIAKHGGSQLATEAATGIKQRTLSKYLTGAGVPGHGVREKNSC